MLRYKLAKEAARGEERQRTEQASTCGSARRHGASTQSASSGKERALAGREHVRGTSARRGARGGWVTASAEKERSRSERGVKAHSGSERVERASARRDMGANAKSNQCVDRVSIHSSVGRPVLLLSSCCSCRNDFFARFCQVSRRNWGTGCRLKSPGGRCASISAWGASVITKGGGMPV